jgi:hypothetical protein
MSSATPCIARPAPGVSTASDAGRERAPAPSRRLSVLPHRALSVRIAAVLGGGRQRGWRVSLDVGIGGFGVAQGMACRDLWRDSRLTEAGAIAVTCSFLPGRPSPRRPLLHF